MKSLKNKVAVITGAAQGIGRGIAERFAKEGAKVVLSDIQGDAVSEAAEAITKSGGEATFITCDVGNKGQAESLIAGAIRAYDGLDVLVNNAGIIHTAEFLDLAEEDFERVLRVNLKGSFLVGQAAARLMVERGGGGSIINMSSVNAVLAIPNQIPYNVSKGGVNQLTHVMALALAPYNIRVNAIGPGTINTEMARVVLNDDAARRKVMSRTPMGRLGEVGEIASVAVFLASADSSYITGQTIYVDGGRLPLNYTMPVAD